MAWRAAEAGVDVIGHRGARGLFPENTLAGFRRAWALNIRSFELDVGLTRDGVPVVSHDPALNPDLTRDTTGAWLQQPGPLIHRLTEAELAAYDVGRIRPGSLTAAQFPHQQPQDGARIPTLKAVLAALPEARLIIEIKTDPRQPDRTAAPEVIAAAVLAAVDEAEAVGRVIIESFDWRNQNHIRRVRPEVRLAYLTSNSLPADPWWAGKRPSQHGGSAPACVAEAGGAGSAWAPLYSDLTQASVREAHALGLAVIPWTVNEPDDMRRMLAWGANGIISDYPDRLAGIAAQAASE